MPQDPQSLRYSCYVDYCAAPSGSECVDRDGQIAERVHHNRPLSPAQRAAQPNRSRNEQKFVFTDLRKNVRTEPHQLGGERLFQDSDQCAECGDDLDSYGLLQRCAELHEKGRIKT